LIEEIKSQKSKLTNEELDDLLNDIAANEEKINFHGKRADDIVKGMLQHSRTHSGQKEPTPLNALCDEYLRLCYHGIRARDSFFNATIHTDYDDTIENILMIPQDIGRVILNVVNNAFYAVNEKKQKATSDYEPTVSIGTKRINNKVAIHITDNGNGIPKPIVDKIFQPFFTTKPTGQGTGLGLSLAYDIVKAHGGELSVKTEEGKSTTFNILLNI
jgi:signal transduction histidine kinase